MGIVTGMGDKGKTRLRSGGEVPKDVPRIELIGTIDELSCALGVARSCTPESAVGKAILKVQQDLVAYASLVACPTDTLHPAADAGFKAKIASLEAEIEQLESALPALESFILSGESKLAAHLHHARAVARRCERRAVTLHRQGPPLPPSLLVWMNRLPDYLWLLARQAGGEMENG